MKAHFTMTNVPNAPKKCLHIRLTKNTLEISIMEYGLTNVVFVKNRFKLNWLAKNMPKRPIGSAKNILDVPNRSRSKIQKGVSATSAGTVIGTSMLSRAT